MLGKRAKKTPLKHNKRKKPTVNIDIIEPNPDGFRVVGWYCLSDISSIGVTAISGEVIAQDVNAITRTDVEASIGEPAMGFSIDCKTNLVRESCQLQTVSKTGEVEQRALLTTQEKKSKTIATRVKNNVEETGNPQILAGVCESLLCCKNTVAFAGWILENQTIEDIQVVASDGKVLTSDSEWLRGARKDVLDAFVGQTEIALPGLLVKFSLTVSRDTFKQEAASILIQTKDGESRISIPEICDHKKDKIQNIAKILELWSPQKPQHINKAATVILPLVQEFAIAQQDAKGERLDFGHPVQRPIATVLITLYGRYDFLRHQLSSFARFGGLESCEIIYVVDDPSISAQVLSLARTAHDTFNVPFSVVTLDRNVGFGMANNIGRQFASAPKLILLNSDVLPTDGQWAHSLCDSLDSLDDAGLIGTRLLFEDCSIQHDGMAPMRLAEYPGLIFNDHPKKGWPVDMSPYESATEVCELVTAACVAIKTDLFDTLEGFDPSYILGDFEDSDLCLRAIELGRVNYIRRDIVLHHLERLSQNLVGGGDWKHKLTLANAVEYNQRWGSELQAIETRATREEAHA